MLIIEDDGQGMTEDDFQNKFLKIGYSKRKNNVSATENGRPFIGRKVSESWHYCLVRKE